MFLNKQLLASCGLLRGCLVLLNLSSAFWFATAVRTSELASFSLLQSNGTVLKSHTAWLSVRPLFPSWGIWMQTPPWEAGGPLSATLFYHQGGSLVVSHCASYVYCFKLYHSFPCHLWRPSVVLTRLWAVGCVLSGRVSWPQSRAMVCKVLYEVRVALVQRLGSTVSGIAVGMVGMLQLFFPVQV